jgi:hypothetical protein
MRNVRGTRHSLPNTRTLTVIAQDPSVKFREQVLTTELTVPAEELLAGPCGYRVNVIDYDASTGTLYKPMSYGRSLDGKYEDPFAFKQSGRTSLKARRLRDRRLLQDPRFHAQNVYAIAMRTLAQFEFALGRRCAWGFGGHQIHIVPHAFADANAFYSRDDRAIFFGYFMGGDGKPVFTCLSHDVVAHETTHALLDGLRRRYMERSTPDQAAFHEGFADIVAVLSMFSLPDVVDAGLDLASGGRSNLIASELLERDALKRSVLFGMAEQMGRELSVIRGDALRRSVSLLPGKPYMSTQSYPEFTEPHRRGELLVAAFLNAALDIWLARLAKIGPVAPGKKDRSIVRDEGARVAGHLLTMAIRALDYCPPTDLTFSDYLSALLTIDREVVPDDEKYGYRKSLLKNFNDYGIEQAGETDVDGTWKRCDEELIYSRSHYDSMLHEPQEVFRFIWENRTMLKIDADSYIEVQSVRPAVRVGPDGFVLHETVAEYIQILTLQANELKKKLGLVPPKGIDPRRRIRIFGGGALVFNEYGQLKYQIANRLENTKRQQTRLDYLGEKGFFDEPLPPSPPLGSQSQFGPPSGPQSDFAQLHRSRLIG